jgi:hypothetical protein
MSKIIKQRKIPPSLNVTDIEERAGFYALAQSAESNKLTRKLSNNIAKSAQLDLFGNGTITDTDFRMYVRGLAEMQSGINKSAPLLLDSLIITATARGLKDTLVSLPLNEYMLMRDLSDEKEARVQVKQDMDTLERIHFELKGSGRHRGNWLTIHISGGTHGIIKNGVIVFRFNEDFYNALRINEKKYLYMYFPAEALQGNLHKNPYKYWLARKIAEHKRMNLGKANEDTISTKALIEACPNFPTREKIIKWSREITREAIEPFERDLNALEPAFTWEYAGEQPSNYETFINSNIYIHWKAYPDTDKLEAGKKKRAQRTGRIRTSKKKTTKLEARVTEIEEKLEKAK